VRDIPADKSPWLQYPIKIPQHLEYELKVFFVILP